MIPVNRTFAPLQVLVDELARCGMEHAVTSPGSRNAPIALALAAEERIRSHSVIDERAAGFVALGIAKATRKPVAVTCTSGSAAANLLPAVVEAREARVPLIVLTADRPPELRDVGAGQAIDQVKLYGSAAKWFVEVGNHEPSRATAIHYRSLACRAWFTACGGRPGAVHLNLPLREPLAPLPEEGLDAADWEGRSDGGPWVVVTEQEPVSLQDPSLELVDRMRSAVRGAIVCGASHEDLVPAATPLAAVTGWPILADALSGVRCGPHDRSHVIAHYDIALRDERFVSDCTPDLVVRLGDTPTSKPLRAWLAGASQIVVDPHAAWHEPTRQAQTIVRARSEWAAAVAARLLAELPDDERAERPPWLEAWLAAEALVAAALDEAPDPFEPKVYAALADSLPDGATVWVASSMPVREVEAFFPASERAIRFLGNRGANGIDGTIASAAGAALASGGPVHVLLGDLALVHDIGGLLAARRLGAQLTIVCVNNGGGGIFDFLPVAQAADPALYEEHIATPAGVDLERVAALADMPHTLATTPSEVRAATARPGLVEVRTDRATSVALHREIYEKVGARLSA
ncbi:MAG: 2-succinyl-5-enolpyruvyl-6-hydroxy-3-cyclohexene-1-carboxylic-acid synthase [Thermoleophilaceae bacterium]